MKIENNEVFRKYAGDDTFDKIKFYPTVSEMWKDSVNNYADCIAIEDDGASYSYMNLDRDAAAIRGLINSKVNVKTGRIGILAPNSYSFVKAYLAVVTNGLCAVVLPAFLDEGTVFGCSMKFGLDALIYCPALEDKLSVLKAKNPGCVLISSEDKGEEAPIVVPNTTDPCTVMFTGGTTGKSKGALLSNKAVMNGTYNSCFGTPCVFNQRYILVLPLSHVFGLIRNLMATLTSGSTLFICRNNKDMFRDCAMFKPTILVMVPALAEMALTLSKKFGKNMLGDSVKYIICGAAVVPPYLMHEYKKLGITLLPGYGLTETANLVSGNPEGSANPESVGFLYGNQEIKIVDGELWIKGDNIMDCYIGEEEDPFEDGFFKTGDLVRIDDKGFLYITGRIKEIIVLPSGENVSPAELETKFNSLDVIQDSQVYEDVNENGVHFLALEVVPRMTVVAELGLEDMASYITEELEAINATLPPFERVNKIIIRDSDFERTPSMKIVRYKKC